MSCFAILVKQLEVVLKEKHIQLDKYADQLCTAFPLSILSKLQRKSFTPMLTYYIHITGGRKSRMKDAEHTVYHKVLYISKVSFDSATTKLLNGRSDQKCCNTDVYRGTLTQNFAYKIPRK